MPTDQDIAGAYAPPAPAGGGRSNLWLFLGAGCGLMLLLCCGGAVALFFAAKDNLQVADDPIVVRRQSNQIADFDVPHGFQATKGTLATVPITGERFVSIVTYLTADEAGVIILAGFSRFSADANDPEELRARMEQRLNREGRQTKRLFVRESRDLKLEIRGKLATFRIQVAEDIDQREYIQVDGVFEDKEALPAFFLAQLPADTYTREDAENLLRSIK